jgi:serine/threonine protein kinase/tetratricopeptide (TPR) repeat protein
VVGTQISRYHILARIGEGGMGEVYLAEDPSLARRLALKFLPASLAAEDTARQRLINEAQAAARLDHPFVCKVYEVGEAGGQPYIAMEFIEGTTLRHRLSAGPIPIKEALRIACEIAEALDSAHKRGIVHRDLKPSNVMLTTDGHVKVMDFGVAKQLAGAVAPALTMTGEIVGTMSYMSPEQLQGAAVDARADVFAFGLLLYEMIAGAHPFERSSPITTASAIINDTEEPLEERRDDIPPLLAHIVSRCLEKDRDRRYQSLNDVKLELSTLAERTGSSSARRPIVRPRRRALWAIVAVAALGAAALVGVSMWQRFAEPALAFQERDWILISDFENLTDDQVFDRSLRLALEVSVGQSQHVNVFPPQSVQATLQRMERGPNERLTEALASEVAVREGVKAVLAGSIARVGNSYSLTARLIEPHSRAAVLSESVQVDGRDHVLDGLNDLGLRVRRRLGESLASISQKSLPLPKATTSSIEALKFYADSLMLGSRYEATSDALLRQAIELDPDFAMAHAELGRRQYLKPDRNTRLEAEQHIVTALALLDRLSPRERLWIQAMADDSRGERRKAADDYRAYLAQYPDDGRGWYRLGWNYMAGLREYDRAVEAFNRTIALNPRDANAHINLATSYTGMRQYERAAETYAKAFALNSDALFGEFVNHEYGFTLVHLGRLEAAAVVFNRMKAQTNSTRRARGFRSMAMLDMYRGHYEPAIAGLREAILIDQANDAGVSEYRDRMILTRALEAKGQTAASAAELVEVERLVSRLTLGPEWLQSLATVEARRGRMREARRLTEQMAERASDATADSATNRSLDFDQAHVKQAMGDVAVAEGRFDEAIQLLEAANLAQSEPDRLESLAAAYAAAGNLDRAAARYAELIARQPFGYESQEDWMRAHVTLGQIYERLNRPDEARKLYEHLLALWKNGDADLVALTRARARLSALASNPKSQIPNPK